MIRPLDVGEFVFGWWKSSSDKPSEKIADVSFPYLIWSPHNRAALTKKDIVELINHLHEMLAEERESNRRE